MPPTVCLNMIVKNESKIIERALKSTLGFIDTYCICDTGSTDDTISVIENFFKTHGIEGSIICEPFVSFGHNRTIALQAAVVMADFVLLLDADMVFHCNILKKDWLNGIDCVALWQSMGGTRYENIRIVKSSLPDLRYIGSTHEYINVPSDCKKITCQPDKVYIEDIGDGGCKDDKYERDIRLLKEELSNDPTNHRALFYLANSLFDKGRDKEAIDCYLKRLQFSKWHQEESYSLMRLGELYYRNDRKEEAICKWLESFAKCNERLESLYLIINHYRKSGNNNLAYMLYKLGENIDCFGKDNPPLFMNESIHRFHFSEEGIIIKFYNQVFDVTREIIQILNWGNETTIRLSLSNYKFYNPQILIDKVYDFSRSFICDEGNKMISSTPSIIIHPELTNHYLMNLRYVNYSILPNGTYDCKSQIKSINQTIILDKSFNEVKQNIIPQKSDNRLYAGIEDIRLFQTKDKVLFSGTTYHMANKLGVSLGEYTDTEKELQHREVYPLHNFSVEKNWVYTEWQKEVCMVYQWSPLKIGKVDTNNKLNIVYSKNMPGIFRRCRGSTNGFIFNDEIWFVTHVVSFEAPRRYYHMFVVFDKEYTKCRYTAPYKFSTSPIEFCLGLIVENDKIIVSYSTMDNNSYVGIVNKSYIQSLLIE